MNHGTIGGGIGNSVGAWDTVQDGHGSGTVGGGSGNEAEATGSTVAGGISNAGGGALSTVGGGYTNFAYGDNAVIAGGNNNRVDGRNATVGGGSLNFAEGEAATIPGGENNVADGAGSFAAGSSALANHDGAFVWNDRAPGATGSTAANQFTARATGGFRLITGVNGQGAPASGAELPAGSGSWSALSDRNAKSDIRPVDGQAILDRLAALPLSTWRYTSQPEGVRHIGPMAQNFHAAFGVGEDDRHIATVDADGVALAAIQALLQVVREQDARIRALEARIEAGSDR